MQMIKVENLSRDFTYYEKESGLKGSAKNLFSRKKKVRHAVSGVSFEVEAGEFVGFIGPNGAGKTTTLKMLSGILYPTSGTATVNGFVPWQRKDAFKRCFSLIAGQKSQLWIDLPANETFYLNKCIYDIPDDEYKKTVNELAEMLNVQDFLKVQVRRLSLGQRMKMELIAALLHKPMVFFLDEPTIGLDIVSQNAMRDYLREYNRKTGATILLTSHYTKDIEELCSRAIIINEGKKVYDGSLQDLKTMEKNAKILHFTTARIINPDELSRYGTVVEVVENKISIEIPSEVLPETLAHILNTYTVSDLSVEELSLEKSIASIFLGGEVRNGTK